MSEKTNEWLVAECIRLDQRLEKTKRLLNQHKAELMMRGAQIQDDTNTQTVRFYGGGGMAIVQDSYTLDMLNPDKLKEVIGEGLFDAKVKRSLEVKYKCDKKLETALKAIFIGDYDLEGNLDIFLDNMGGDPPTAEQKKILLKKLKGDYEKDRKLLQAVLGPEDWDVELYFIHRLKQGELIRGFFPEEGLSERLEQIRRCILVEYRTGITIDYDKENVKKEGA